MKDRILQLMQAEGLSNSEFAAKIGISASSLSHIFSGRNKPSLDVVTGIHKAYPDLNLNWILYGTGEMKSKGIENPGNADGGQMHLNFSNDKGFTPTEQPVKETVREEIRYIDKPQPKITEIRIFFDNGTYEVFRREK